jgi:hypothetical protein
MPASRGAALVRRFLVKNIECRKAGVSDFLLIEHDFVTHYRIVPQRMELSRTMLK